MESLGVEKTIFFSPSAVSEVFFFSEKRWLWDRASMSLGVIDDIPSSSPEQSDEASFCDQENGQEPHALLKRDFSGDILKWAKRERAARPLGVSWNAENLVQGVTIHASQICNLACRYCAAGGDGTYGNPGRLVTEAAFTALEKLFSGPYTDSQVRISFSGGEPLFYTADLVVLCEKLTELAHQNSKVIRWSLVTNGSRWNETNLQLIARYHMDVSLSIDGPPSIQNQRRPQKLHQDFDWDKALDQFFKFIQRARAQGYRGKVTASSVFDRHYTDVYCTLQYLRQWEFDYFDWTWNYFEKNALALKAFEQSYFAALADLWQSGGEKLLRKVLAVDRIYRALDGKNPLHHYCGAGLNHLTMNRKGEWSACPWLVEDPNYRVHLEQRKLWSVVDSSQQPNCSSCWAKPLCGGGCRFMHLQGNSASFCYWTQSLISQIFDYYCREGVDNEVSYS